MRERFRDVLSIEGVKGLILFSFAGDILFKEMSHITRKEIERWGWGPFIESLTDMKETDLTFEKGRLYIRRTEIGYLLVLMGSFVPIAMMRLQCDILLPSLKPVKSAKGIRGLFKK